MKEEKGGHECWKELLKEGYKANENWAKTLPSGILTTSETLTIRDEISKLLRDPPVLLPTLKREENIKNLDTVFLNHLEDQIYRENNPNYTHKCFVSDNNTILEEILSKLSQKMEDLIEESKSYLEENEIANLRFYYEEEVASSYIVGQSIASTAFSSSHSAAISTFSTNMQMQMNMPPIPSLGRSSDLKAESQYLPSSFQPQMQFQTDDEIFGGSTIFTLYSNIKELFTHFCKLTYCELDTLREKPAFLLEYTKRWNAFSASMIHLNEKMQPLNQLINTAYESMWVTYPCFPKFSIWRMMFVLWRRHVYEKLEEDLHCGIQLYAAHLRNNLYEEHCQTQKKEKQSTSQKKVVGSLFAGKFNLDWILSDVDIPKPQSLFMNSKDLARVKNAGLLKTLIFSIIDLSFNDLTIHYIDSTKAKLEDTPYDKLHKKLLKNTSQIYKKYAESLPFEKFVDLITADYKMMKDVVLPSTQDLLSKTQSKLILNYIRFRIKYHCKKFEKKIAKGRIGTSTLMSFETRTLNNDSLECYLKEWKKFDLPTLKTFLGYLQNEERNLIQMFNEKTAQFAKTENLEDILIEFVHSKKGINLELSENEKILYDLNGDVKFHEVKKMYENYMESLVSMEQ